MADGIAVTAGTGPTVATDDTGASGHVQVVKLAVSTDGSAQLLPADASNGIDVDVTRVQSTVTVAASAAATGGFSKAKFAGQTTTVQTVKGAAGKLAGWYVYNGGAAVGYVQIFDVAGTVTLGTTVPDLTLGVPAGGGCVVSVGGEGIDFANAIKLACATTATGSGAPATGLDVNVWYA